MRFLRLLIEKLTRTRPVFGIVGVFLFVSIIIPREADADDISVPDSLVFGIVDVGTSVQKMLAKWTFPEIMTL